MIYNNLSPTIITVKINQMNKYATLIVILAIGLFVGNRIFNHLHAWLGIAIMFATTLYTMYQVYKYAKEDEKDN